MDKCDILIGIFWAKLGSPTKIAKSGTVEEIQRHLSERKLAMLYFSKQEIPSDVNLDQLKMVREFKNEIKNKSLYGEFSDERDLESKLYTHLEIKISEGKFRSTWDSDIMAQIEDDDELVTQINAHFPLAARNLLQNIVDEDRNEQVWLAIIEKLSKSPADLREALIFMAKRGAFRHKAYEEGYKNLAKYSQHDFGNFMNSLYSINKYELRAFQVGPVDKRIFLSLLLHIFF